MSAESSGGSLARDPIAIDLALQGGGAHGAFTWGVLDRLLEEPWLEIDGISGTSAGAMSAAVLAAGYTQGGASGARRALAHFWRSVSEAARFNPFRRGPLQPFPARSARYAARPLDAGFLTLLHRHGPPLPPGITL